MLRRTAIMGTATFQNEVNESLPKYRPTLYHCAECGNKNEFTKRGLETHKRKCSHQASCTCFVCSFKPSAEHSQKSFKTSSFISHVSFKITNLSKTRGIAATRNLVQVSDMIKKMQSAIVNQARIENLKSSKSGHSIYSYPNQILELHPLTSVSGSKCIKRKSSKNPDFESSKPDRVPCDRKIYCIICKMHIFWRSFGTHILQHSIKAENSHLMCPVCSESYLLPNYYLMHFFSHTSDHDCQECHCSNDRCPCFTQENSSSGNRKKNIFLE